MLSSYTTRKMRGRACVCTRMCARVQAALMCARLGIRKGGGGGKAVVRVEFCDGKNTYDIASPSDLTENR